MTLRTTMPPTDKDAIIKYLSEHVSKTRFSHTIGSAKVAGRLAGLHGVPREKAVIAALLHDAGKGLSNEKMISYAARRRLRIPDKRLLMRHNPSLLHSYIGSDIARRRFGVRDRDILEAIALHTLGGATMSALAKIIYLSDVIAPDRSYRGIKKIRTLSMQDLDGALQLAMASKLRHIVESREWIAPQAVEAWNALVARRAGGRAK